MPTVLKHAPGAIDLLADEVKALGSKRPMLVTDRGLVNAGLVDEATNTLEGGHVDYVLFKGAVPNPDIQLMDGAADMYKAEGYPGRKDFHEREIARVIRAVFGARIVFLPLAVFFLSFILFLDYQSKWTITILGALLTLQVLVSTFDMIRLWKQKDFLERLTPLDLLTTLVLLTGIIWLTGAMESPFLVIYIPLGGVTGVVLVPTRARWLLLAGISCCIWLLASAGLLEHDPRTIPRLMGLTLGFNESVRYIVIKAVVLNVVVLVSALIGNKIHQAIGNMLDQAIKARQQTLETLAERNQDLANLASTIAHELKNPLTSIHGLVQLMDSADDKDRLEPRLNVLKKEVKRMRGILDEFLNFSRPIGDLIRHEVNMAELFDELTLLHEGLADSKGIQIINPDKSVLTFFCDQRKIKQALTNLLQNAIEASHSGRTVEWVAKNEAEAVNIGVRDNGPGIDPEIIDRVTIPGVTTKQGGSGIGLAVARIIAEQHGGRLLVENCPEGGCLALLRLPNSPHQIKEERSIDRGFYTTDGIAGR